MGQLRIPESGAVYLDANCVIYSVEKIAPYAEILEPIWVAAESGTIGIATSELSLIETLVKPLRERDELLSDVYRTLLRASNEVACIPVSAGILERAASIRASANLRTPDAIHAASALEIDATLFVTNDVDFRRVPGLPLGVLSQVAAPSGAALEAPAARTDASGRPERFPVRQVKGCWEVLITGQGGSWLPCRSEDDARIIAMGSVLEYEALERARSGSMFAADLERLADTLARNGVGFGSRFFRRMAEETRGSKP